MAVVWSQRHAGSCYEVRTAGASRRLYKDGVFHSQWNPQRPLAGGVWDLLFVPALFLEPKAISRVLMLGVGGGAAINLYRALLPVKHIVGVELDPVHLQVAKEQFGVLGEGVDLHCDDALNWVKNYRGAKFNVIVEDLFSEHQGEPVRVAKADEQWFDRLRRLLSPDGLLIVNFEDTAQMRASAPGWARLTGEPLIAYQFTQPSYGNCVCVFLTHVVQPASLRARLEQLLHAYPASRQGAQRFRMRRVQC